MVFSRVEVETKIERTAKNDVLQTAALLSHFVPFIKNVLHQFASA